MIELIGIKKHYQVGASELWALGGVDLKIERGEFVAFQGPSGSGKTTLLNIIGLLDVPTEGKYLLEGNEVGGGNHRERARHRSQYLGFIQMQRVAIARALVKNPPVVIADEPTANLDTKTGIEIVELMKRLNRERGTTFLFATHDEKIIKYMDKIYNLVDGCIVPTAVWASGQEHPLNTSVF